MNAAHTVVVIASLTDLLFTGAQATLACYVAAHAGASGRQIMERHAGEPRLGYLDHDWSLNDAAR